MNLNNRLSTNRYPKPEPSMNESITIRIKSLFIKPIIERMDAPKTLRTPISFLRLIIFKDTSAKMPEAERTIVDMARKKATDLKPAFI